MLAACARIEAASDIEAAWAETVAALDAEGVGVVLYISTDAARADLRTRATVPALYEGADPAADPFLDHCCASYAITHTGVAFLPDYPYLPEGAVAFIRRAEGFGFQSGLAIPMRLQGSDRYGGFNLGTALDRAAFEARIVPRQEQFRTLCLVAHRRMEELGLDAPASAPVDFRTRMIAPDEGALSDLSPREREVLWLQLQGLCRKEVARMCAISPHTVAEYTSKAYRKLGVSNRMQAARLVLTG